MSSMNIAFSGQLLHYFILISNQVKLLYKQIISLNYSDISRLTYPKKTQGTWTRDSTLVIALSTLIIYLFYIEASLYDPILVVTGRFGPIPIRTPGRFDSIPFRSGRFGLGRFGPILGVGRFGPILVGRFGSLYFK